MSWAHRTIYLTFDTDWRITYSDGQTIVGMQAILDYESSDGWELVAAVVEDVREGKCSVEEAERVYGVSVDTHGWVGARTAQ